MKNPGFICGHDLVLPWGEFRIGASLISVNSQGSSLFSAPSTIMRPVQARQRLGISFALVRGRGAKGGLWTTASSVPVHSAVGLFQILRQGYVRPLQTLCLQ